MQLHGELSLVFFNSEFQYAVCKRPAPGDFRVNKDHGGTNTVVEVSGAIVEQVCARSSIVPSIPTVSAADVLLLVLPHALFVLNAGERHASRLGTQACVRTS